MALSQEIFKKLEILTDAAKYDVACTSSGSSRRGGQGTMGNAVSRGLCHCFAADGRCISLLKILQTNECVYDCKYCLNRCSNDVPRATFKPEEIAELTIAFYRRNYIEGLFLSSGIRNNPDDTMEGIYQAVYLLRTKYRFNGYIHVKAIPGANPLLIEKTGWIVDRMSVNMELPTADGLRTLAPQKSRKKILTPMRQIQMGRKESFLLSGYEPSPQMLPASSTSAGGLEQQFGQTVNVPKIRESSTHCLQESHPNKSFVPAGQSTQMIIGATPENDYQILSVAESLYQKFELKRVFYSAFVQVNQDAELPALPGGPPLLREHRLYQADWLLRFYGFGAGELLSEKRPNFNVFLDPKCDWALSHLEQFPVEINRADYYTLLRVPGIGPKSAQRIIKARRISSLDFADLKRAGVVLKRAIYFITCSGRQMYPLKIEEDFILRNLMYSQSRTPAETVTYRQLSLFDDDRVFGEVPQQLLQAGV